MCVDGAGVAVGAAIAGVAVSAAGAGVVVSANAGTAKAIETTEARMTWRMEDILFVIEA